MAAAACTGRPWAEASVHRMALIDARQRQNPANVTASLASGASTVSRRYSRRLVVRREFPAIATAHHVVGDRLATPRASAEIGLGSPSALLQANEQTGRDEERGACNENLFSKRQHAFRPHRAGALVNSCQVEPAGSLGIRYSRPATAAHPRGVRTAGRYTTPNACLRATRI